jgi:hypothetical protein
VDYQCRPQPPDSPSVSMEIRKKGRPGMREQQAADEEIAPIMHYPLQQQSPQQAGTTAVTTAETTQESKLSILFGLENFRLSEDGLLLYDGAASRRDGHRRDREGHFMANAARIVICQTSSSGGYTRPSFTGMTVGPTMLNSNRTAGLHPMRRPCWQDNGATPACR